MTNDNNVMLDAAMQLWRRAGKTHSVVAQGRSMFPMILDGDLLHISHDISRVKRGSVVVFRHGGMLIAHRVIKIMRGLPIRYVTKGDNTWRYDRPVSAEQLVGLVLVVQRKDQLITLDSRIWQTIGWFISFSTPAITALYSRLQHLKHRRLPLALPQSSVTKSSVHVFRTWLTRGVAKLPRF